MTDLASVLRTQPVIRELLSWVKKKRKIYGIVVQHNNDILTCLIASLLMKPHTPVPYVLINWKTQTVVPREVYHQQTRTVETTKNFFQKNGMTQKEKKKFQKNSRNMLHSGMCAWLIIFLF